MSNRRYELCGGNLAAFRDTASQEILLAGPAGTGKAQPLSEPVMTPTGPRPMGELRVGDDVLTPDGSRAPVLAVHPQGDQDVYRVRFSCGRVVRCTADHLWTVWRLVGKAGKGGGVRAERATLTAAEIASRLTVGQASPRKRFWVEPPQPAVFVSTPVSIPAYTFGVWLGDGSPVGPGRGCPQFTSADPFVSEEIGRELTDGHTVRKIGDIQYRIVSPRRYYQASAPHPDLRKIRQKVQLRVRSLNRTRYVGLFASEEEAMAAFRTQPELSAPVPQLPYQHRIAALGLSGCLAHEKFVPTEYKINSPSVRLALVQGLMDTDGTVDRKTGMPSYCTTSRRLARDFRFLIESLGGGVTIRAKRTTRRVAFICHIRFNDPAELFRLPRKRSLCKCRVKYPFRRWIESIRYEGREASQCISVDHPERLYLTRGFVPTHNTFTNLARLLHFGDTFARARMLIVRKTRVSLTETALVTWERDVLGEGHPILGDREMSRAHRHAYKFPNGSILVTAGMDKPDKVLSSEWDLIYVNEATELEESEWEILGSRLRANAGDYDQLIGDCNPSSPKHWLYKRCQAKKTKLYPTHHYENPRYYDYVRRKWTEAGRRYVHGRLKQLTGSRRERFLYGKWVAAEGAVYDYVTAAHDLPAGWRPPSPHWRRLWSIDWGDRSPTVLQIWAVDDEGRMHLYLEVFRCHLRADVLGKWVKENLLDTGAEPVPFGAVCDHDPDKKADFERESGVYLTMADKADRERGIQATQARFDREVTGHDEKGEPLYGKPRIYFAEDSRVHDADPVLVDEGRPASTVDEVVEYVWDPKFVKDEPIGENDHGMDAMRYAVMYADANMTPGVSTGPLHEAPAQPRLPKYMGKVGSATGW